MAASVQQFLSEIDPSLSTSVQEFTSSFAENFGSMVSDISVSAISWLSSYIAKIPYFIAAVFISVIATFFISADYDRIKAFIVRQMPEKCQLFLTDIREYGVKTLGKYFKSYALIMFITFCELSLALWLLGVKNFAAKLKTLRQLLPLQLSLTLFLCAAVAVCLFPGRYFPLFRADMHLA